MGKFRVHLTGLIYVLLVPLVSSQLLNASYCYGDSSDSNNLVNVICSTGVVKVEAIIAASKNLSQGCPQISHIYTPGEQANCCSIAEHDCFTPYDGNIDSYLACNGQQQCTRIPIIRTRTSASCAANQFPAFTNYMVFQYRCVPDYKLYGACNSTEECEDEYAICDHSICVCITGTSENNDKCYRDGRPNGYCNDTVECLGGNISCLDSVCVCDQDFTAVDETCMEDGTLGGICSDIIPCIDDKAVCSEDGVCECVSGYVERNSACIKADIELINATSCYGDSSSGDNLLDVTCDIGVIYIDDIIVGAKPLSLNCPLEDHINTTTDFDLCCTYNSSDCLRSYTGDRSLYLDCDGQPSCQRLPVVRVQTDPLCNATGTYGRFSNYMIIMYYCVPDYRLHGSCGTSEECTDENAVCNNNICECAVGFTEIDDSCPEDGSLGGRCNASIPCEDQSSYCTADNICECIGGYTDIDGICIEDGTVGGICSSGGSCSDPNTVCSSGGVCECISGYSEVNRTCIQDGIFGGKCDANGDCTAANTACDSSSDLNCGRLTCDPGICLCIAGYGANAQGICVPDGTLGGKCSNTIACTDSNTICSGAGVCECISGYSEISGVCKKDGGVGGFCNSSITCTDSGSVCISNVCQCTVGYSNRNDECIPDGDVGGKCSNGECTQSDTICVSGICVCVSGYSEVNRLCKKDGDVLGICSTNQDCEDSNTFCNTNSGLMCGISVCDTGVCQCVVGYSASDGTCIKDGLLGGKCSDTIACVDSNTVCTGGVCECISGYTANAGVCFQDGHVGGVCNSGSTCVDSGAVCSSSNICECAAGYSDRNYVCIPDGEIGGRCSNGQCTTTNAVCTSGSCVCISGYSEVNNECRQDGGVLGLCGANQACDDSNAVCNTNPDFLCGISECDPGVCMCVTDYSVSSTGTCVEDGLLGNQCLGSGTCSDSKAECSATNVCQCQSQYTQSDGECVNDGEPGGKCLSSQPQCLDSHSICSAGICICNAVRNYKKENGACIREDGHIHGQCSTDADCLAKSSQSECTLDGLCACISGYSEENGQCVNDYKSTVSACEGADPLNTLQPDCPQGSKAVVLRELNVSKPASTGCPTTLETYNGATYKVCCTPEEEDCVVVTSIAVDCDPSIIYLPTPNYKKIEYICTEDGNIVEADDNGDASGSPAYLTSPGYPDNDDTTQSDHSCSVQASCQSTIHVYMLLNELQKSSTECLQILEITEGAVVTTFTCSSAVTSASIYTSMTGYFRIKVVNTNQASRGKFVLKFEASISSAEVNVSCGNRLDLIADVLSTCPPVPGALGGQCSETSPCVVANAVCINNICQCTSGFIRQGDTCGAESGEEEGGSSGSATIMAIAAALGALFLLGASAIIYFLFKDKIRRKFCPREEPTKPEEDLGAHLPHLVAGPTPMNTKFPGGRDPFGAEKKKTLPPLNEGELVDYIHKEQGEDIKKRNSLEKRRSFRGIHPSIHTGEDSVVRTRFSRSSSSFNFNVIPNGTPPPIIPNPTPSQTTAEKPEKEKKKKDKKKKKRANALKALKRAKGGINSVNAFQLPTRGADGVLMRAAEPGLDGFVHPAPTLTPNGDVPVAPYPPVFKTPNTVAPLPINQVSSSGLGPNTSKDFLSRSFNGHEFETGHPRPNPISEQQITPQSKIPSAWKRAGIASSFSSHLVRRGSVILDISTVDEPNIVETTELQSDV